MLGGARNFVFSHGNDVIHVEPEVLKVNWPDAWGAQAVGGGARDVAGRELDDPASAEAGLRIGGEFGFNTNYFYIRIAELDGGGDAAEHASSTDRGQNGFDVRKIFENFEPHGALSGDDVLIVVRRDDDVSMSLSQLFRLDLALGAARANCDDFRAQRCCGAALDGRCIIGHYDHGFDPERSSSVGHALGVVAAGIGNHAAAQRFSGKGSNFVVGSAKFEGTDRLLVFGFEKQAAGGGAGEVEFN